jgi:predicted transcriptional regulator of viral defense system
MLEDKVSVVDNIYRGFMKTETTEKRAAAALSPAEIVSSKEVVRLRDLAAQGITTNQLHRLIESGCVERVGRGLYRAKEADITEHHTLLEAALLVPKGVICLLSALRFHDLTTQAPFEVWMAIDNKAWRPTIPDVPLRIHYFSGRALTQGVERHEIEGVQVKIYSAAKTVADCFKFRNKIGVDVAIEALRDYLRKRLPEKDLWRYAEICRVRNVIYPYLEALQ